MKWLQEFKMVAAGSNVIDKSVDIVVKGAPGKIVPLAMVDIIIPPAELPVSGVSQKTGGSKTELLPPSPEVVLFTDIRSILRKKD